MSEPIRLVRLINQSHGVELVNLTIGNPYFNRHVNRPYDKGGYVPSEHPLEGVSRMCRCIGRSRRRFPR
jgi:hypothetical protein